MDVKKRVAEWNAAANADRRSQEEDVKKRVTEWKALILSAVDPDHKERSQAQGSGGAASSSGGAASW